MRKFSVQDLSSDCAVRRRALAVGDDAVDDRRSSSHLDRSICKGRVGLDAFDLDQNVFLFLNTKSNDYFYIKMYVRVDASVPTKI